MDSLFYRNLPLTTRDSELVTLFAPYGTVLEKRVLMPVEGAKGAGALVRMSSQEEAASAIQGLDGHFPLGSSLPLLLRYADTPEEKARKVAKRDRNGFPAQQFQPAQALYEQRPPMQSSAGGYPMQHATRAYPTQQAFGGSSRQQPYTGFMPSQQAPPAANGASYPMQQTFMPQQSQQPALGNGMQQPHGYFSPQHQGNVTGMQPQSTPNDFSSPAGPSIPGLSGAIKQEPMADGYGGFGAPSMPEATGMSGQLMQGPYSAGPSGSNSMNGSFMPAAGPAGPTGDGSMNGGFMPGAGPPSGNAPFSGGAPFMPGFDHSAGGFAPMGPMGPGIQGPDLRAPGPIPNMQPQPQPGGISSSLYVKNLPQEADKLFLYERFAPHGAILGIKLLIAPETGKCKGVAFVNYATSDAAMAAIEALHGTKVGEKVLHVSIQLFRGQRS